MGRRVSNQGERGENRKSLIREIPNNKQAATWQQINLKTKKGPASIKIFKTRKKGQTCNKSESYKAQRSEEVWQWRSTMTDKNWNHGCLLPCSKTWLSGVSIITNDRIFFRGRFRGRLIKRDAHRPLHLLAIEHVLNTRTICTRHRCAASSAGTFQRNM